MIATEFVRSAALSDLAGEPAARNDALSMVATRCRVSARISPSLPCGGIQPIEPCTSVLLRIMWRFGSYSVSAPEQLPQPFAGGLRNATYETSARNPHLSRCLCQRERLCAELRRDR